MHTCYYDSLNPACKSVCGSLLSSMCMRKNKCKSIKITFYSFAQIALVGGFLLHLVAVTNIGKSVEGFQLYTHPHSVLMAILPGEPGIGGCPCNYPFIRGLCILLGQTFHVILDTIPPVLFRASSLFQSFNLPLEDFSYMGSNFPQESGIVIMIVLD